jgi:outer membrane protein assembly factor BamC
MNKQIILSLCALTVIAGCSSADSRKQASGSLEYLDVTTAEALKVPPELSRPNMSDRYVLPELGGAYELKGTQVSVASPRLVLPLVTGSHVEEGSSDARVMFDQINDNEPLPKTIWDTVLGYLELNDIAVEEFDRDNNELTTGWVITRQVADSQWYQLGDEFNEQAKRFKLNLEVAPHGRTAALTAELIEFIDENGNSVLNQVNPFELRNTRVDFLNFIIAEYDVGIRLAQNQRISLIRDGFVSKLGFNPDGDPAFVVDAEYENAWPRLLLVLRKMGFDVIDLDQSSGLIFVKFNGPEESWWSGLFGKEEIKLDKVNYRLSVQSVGQQTSITFKDNENIPFDVTTVTDLFSVFADYMAEDDLDI